MAAGPRVAAGSPALRDGGRRSQVLCRPSDVMVGHQRLVLQSMRLEGQCKPESLLQKKLCSENVLRAEKEKRP